MTEFELVALIAGNIFAHRQDAALTTTVAVRVAEEIVRLARPAKAANPNFAEYHGEAFHRISR